MPSAGTVCSAEGVVTGAPRRWLLLEGLALLAGALIAFGALGQPWWLVPAVMLGAGYWQADRLVMALAWSGSPTSAWTAFWARA